jgi:putative redox protein
VASAAALDVDLTWLGDLRFAVAVGPSRAAQPPAQGPPLLTLDSAGAAGPSPVAALGAALAGCMAMDLAHILTRGRHVLRTFDARLRADRAETEPRRFVRVALHFTIAGDPPREAVERALALSRERYCSVWHSLRQDIEFQVTFELTQ